MDSMLIIFTMRQNASAHNSKSNSAITVAIMVTKPHTVSANHNVKNVEKNTIYGTAKIQSYIVCNVIETMKHGSLSALQEFQKLSCCPTQRETPRPIFTNSARP